MAKQTDSKFPQIRFKGFEGEWVGDRLGERVEFFTGLTYSPRNVQNGVGTLVLRSSNVKNGEIVDADDVYVDPKIVNSKNVEVGDIAVVVRNGSRSLIGKHAQIKTRMDATVIGAFMTGIHSDRPAFTNSLLDTPQFNKEIAKNLGATINQITTGAFKEMMFRFPDPTEQAQIGSYFRELDRLIGLQQRKHDKLVTLKKAMLQKMFPQPGATTPEIRFSGFSGAWEKRSLRKLTNKVTEKNVLREHSETFTNSAELGVVSQRDYFDKDISNVESIGGYYIVEPESFVYNPRISASAPVGPINRNKLGRTGIRSPLYAVFRTKDVDNTFLEYFFKTSLWHPFMLLNGDTGARGDRFSIKETVFMELPVPYPVLAEQQKIGNYFHTLDELISKHTLQLEKLKQLKSACLERMFV